MILLFCLESKDGLQKDLNVPHEGYSRNTMYVLNLISTFSLDIFESYCEILKLQINVNKTKVMIFC